MGDEQPNTSLTQGTLLCAVSRAVPYRLPPELPLVMGDVNGHSLTRERHLLPLCTVGGLHYILSPSSLVFLLLLLP